MPIIDRLQYLYDTFHTDMIYIYINIYMIYFMIYFTHVTLTLIKVLKAKRFIPHAREIFKCTYSKSI